MRCCRSLRTLMPWLKWWLKAGVQQWDMCREPTEFPLTGCLTEPIWILRLDPVHSHQTPDCRQIDNREFHTWGVEQSSWSVYNISHFSSLCCAQSFSLTSCTRTNSKRMQEQNGDNRIVATSKPTTMNLAVSGSTSSSTVHSPIADCIEKPGDTQSILSNRLVKYRETCRDRRRPGTPELSWRVGEYVETGRFRKLVNRRQWQSLATQSPCYNKLCAALG